MAQRNDLHVLVSIAHRQQAQHGERVRHTQVSQSQQHGGPPCRSDHQLPESAAQATRVKAPDTPYTGSHQAG
jgi:hypothetical protein